MCARDAQMVENRDGIPGKAFRGIGWIRRLIAQTRPTMIKDNDMVSTGKIIPNSIPTLMITTLPVYEQERLTFTDLFIIETRTILSCCVWHRQFTLVLSA